MFLQIICCLLDAATDLRSSSQTQTFELEVCVNFGFLRSYFQYYFSSHIANLLLMEYFDIGLGCCC